jgi:chromosomal replication initiation ATPase DnaA
LGPERVIAEVARQYKVTRDDIFRGKRGQENEARKVAMYLVRRCCDWTLTDLASYFGSGSYAAVSWSCRVIESKMAKDKKTRDQIERLAASIG